jgi:RND family efflux transporter MFP subunit
VENAKTGSMPLIAEYRGELDTDVAELAAQGSGRLLSVKVNLGDTFEKGDVLAKVDAAETRRMFGEAGAQAESAVAAKQRAAAQLETAKEEAERGVKLLAENLISQQQLSALRSQVKVLEAEVSAAEAQRSAALARVELYREQLGQAELKAPFQGAVGRRYLDPGATVQPGTVVLRLVKGGPLDVRFRASEIHLSRLKAGTSLDVSTLATGKKTFEGRLERVSAEVSRTDRSVEAEGILLAEHSELRPGMYAMVRVSLGTLEDATIVPSGALLSRIVDDGSSERGVYVVEGTQANYRKVDVVGEHAGQAAVIGVDSGKMIVVQGQDLLSDGARVKIGQEKKP